MLRPTVNLGGALASFTILALTAHTAGAAELSATAAFAVARDPSGQRAAAVADALLRTRAEKAKSLRLIEPARVLSGDPRTREEETLERARAAFADGRRAYDALNLDEAIARLGQAVNLYQQTGPMIGDVEELRNALNYLGAALTLRGSPDEGESTFTELLTIDPTFQLSGFPPAVEKAFEQASKRIEQAPNGSVEIYSTPPYAAVYLDGRFEGVTPVTLSDVLAGTHYLRIEKVGYTVHGAPLEISPNQKITSQTRLRSMKKGVELRDITARATEEVVAEGMGGSLRTLARMLTADTLIFVSVTQSGNDATFTGGVFDASTGTRLATERAVLSVAAQTFGSELDTFTQRLIAAAERTEVKEGGTAEGGNTGSGFGLSEGSGVGRSGSGSGTGGNYSGGTVSGSMTPTGPNNSTTATVRPTPSEEYLGWTMIGVGSAAVVTGVVFGILAQTVHSDFKKTSQESPDLENIRNRGKTDALISDICVGAGVAAAIGGTIILLVSGSDEPTPEELLRNPRSAGIVPTEGGAILTFGTSFP